MQFPSEVIASFVDRFFEAFILFCNLLISKFPKYNLSFRREVIRFVYNFGDGFCKFVFASLFLHYPFNKHFTHFHFKRTCLGRCVQKFTENQRSARRIFSNLIGCYARAHGCGQNSHLFWHNLYLTEDVAWLKGIFSDVKAK